ncbi:uncharacterized protein LOC143032709 [Oratosquilla oratoria]|uniref:uncharacterized protein LOC143032709 n=1 Tax=Oratosquilla oratoria TaxID=337810 RepID=UPI003F762E8C
MKVFSGVRMCVLAIGLLASVAGEKLSPAQVEVLSPRVRRSPKYPNLESFGNRLFKSNSVLSSRLQRASKGNRIPLDDSLEKILRLTKDDGTFIEDTEMYLNAAPWTRTQKYKGTNKSPNSDSSATLRQEVYRDLLGNNDHVYCDGLEHLEAARDRVGLEVAVASSSSSTASVASTKDFLEMKYGGDILAPVEFH